MTLRHLLQRFWRVTAPAVVGGGIVALSLLSGTPLRAADAPSNTPDPSQTQTAPDAPAESLDVTITGRAKDDVPIQKLPPPTDLPLQDVLALSPEGQTETILRQQVQHMDYNDKIKSIVTLSRQTLSPEMTRIPQAPFFRMTIPAVTGSDVKWEFRIVNQSNETVKSLTGDAAPTAFMEWDGFTNSELQIRVGQAYTPMMIYIDAMARTQKYYGDAVQYDTIQYEQDGLLHVEFNNDRLYEKESAEFSKDALSYLEAALDLLRLRMGTPYRVIVYDPPAAAALTQKRLDLWKKFLKKRLLIRDEDMTLTTEAPSKRGRVTSLMMIAHP